MNLESSPSSEQIKEISLDSLISETRTRLVTRPWIRKEGTRMPYQLEDAIQDTLNAQPIPPKRIFLLMTQHGSVLLSHPSLDNSVYEAPSLGEYSRLNHQILINELTLQEAPQTQEEEPSPFWRVVLQRARLAREQAASSQNK